MFHNDTKTYKNFTTFSLSIEKTMQKYSQIVEKPCIEIQVSLSV